MNGFTRLIAVAALTSAFASTATLLTTALSTVALPTVALADDATINGEVRKIDEAAGKITLKHGPAKSLGMDDPMTMVYRVKDAGLLKTVKVGDKVTFEAEKTATGYTVTKIQEAK